MTETAHGVTPGLVCAHHHLYTAVTRGVIVPGDAPERYIDLMQQLWWRAEAELDHDMVSWATKLGALEALESGCTTIFDHHESSGAIEGSLDVIAAACAEVGVRVNCTYATSDRHGAEAAAAGVAENSRFLSDGGDGMVGLLSATDCSGDTIEASLALAEEHSVGVHVKVAESSRDAGAGIALARRSDVDWILAHGINLPDGIDFDGVIAHSPRSNMFHGVGYAHPSRFTTPVALGTDVFGPDLIAEFQAAFLKQREVDLAATPADAWAWLETGWDLQPDARDDVVTWTQAAMDGDSVAPAAGVRAIEVVVGDETVLRDGRPTRVDADEIRAKAAEQAVRLLAKL